MPTPPTADLLAGLASDGSEIPSLARPANRDRIGGIVLCGGRSSRMGRSKASLMLGGESLLRRAVRTLLEVASPVVVVAADGQALPALPPEVEIITDELRSEGPLPALILGLRTLSGRADAAFAMACDLPFLDGETIGIILKSLELVEVAAPSADGFDHPLAAAYRLSVLPKLLAMQAAGERKLQRLLGTVEAVRVAVEPGVLRNLNTPADYAAALRAIES